MAVFCIKSKTKPISTIKAQSCKPTPIPQQPKPRPASSTDFPASPADAITLPSPARKSMCLIKHVLTERAIEEPDPRMLR
uniref:Uncharacterized protein n=1 Tax=Salix viminalis TaxID=40686 RepID=A0A6N2MZ88_SALVM